MFQKESPSSLGLDPDIIEWLGLGDEHGKQNGQQTQNQLEKLDF